MDFFVFVYCLYNEQKKVRLQEVPQGHVFKKKKLEMSAILKTLHFRHMVYLTFRLEMMCSITNNSW